jgi:CubicO group peptidase (beta-lactamase class C family)
VSEQRGIVPQLSQRRNSADKPHILNSVSKSFTFTAIGLAIQKPKLKLTIPC